ncbi:hypothetical protein DACRYDRAFT_15899 [Dacryopinax primogenitus]|uniref:Uncharacterized protein n=1 Tax=Dacryopinax primogenitus (strain DJM 731) TaxID=1858805 RepID=M5FVR7_DACPD|nr:uncharacterized protein DACRYDRAFT_15899 [Dacryopinax primogenitus]EJU01931.1 hypothetical protein DACRYDRAFT_15899 [Dacryopinax primogenitus]
MALHTAYSNKLSLLQQVLKSPSKMQIYPLLPSSPDHHHPQIHPLHPSSPDHHHPPLPNDTIIDLPPPPYLCPLCGASQSTMPPRRTWQASSGNDWPPKRQAHYEEVETHASSSCVEGELAEEELHINKEFTNAWQAVRLENIGSSQMEEEEYMDNDEVQMDNMVNTIYEKKLLHQPGDVHFGKLFGVIGSGEGMLTPVPNRTTMHKMMGTASVPKEKPLPLLTWHFVPSACTEAQDDEFNIDEINPALLNAAMNMVEAEQERSALSTDDLDALDLVEQIRLTSMMEPSELAQHLPSIMFDFQEFMINADRSGNIGCGPFQPCSSERPTNYQEAMEKINKAPRIWQTVLNDNLSAPGVVCYPMADVYKLHGSWLLQIDSWAQWALFSMLGAGTMVRSDIECIFKKLIDNHAKQFDHAMEKLQQAEKPGEADACTFCLKKAQKQHEEDGRHLQQGLWDNLQTQQHAQGTCCNPTMPMPNAQGALCSPAMPTERQSTAGTTLSASVSNANVLGMMPLCLTHPANLGDAQNLPEEVSCIWHHHLGSIGQANRAEWLIELHNVFWYNNLSKWYDLLVPWMGDKMFDAISLAMFKACLCGIWGGML